MVDGLDFVAADSFVRWCGELFTPVSLIFITRPKLFTAVSFLLMAAYDGFTLLSFLFNDNTFIFAQSAFNIHGGK